MRKAAEGKFSYAVDGLDPRDEQFSSIGDEEEEILDGFAKVMRGEPFRGKKIEVSDWGIIVSSYYPLKNP
ncbi:hypothetical protein SAMN02745975_00497 [Geosporobacter subterraneus DSM 17957]|uniref:Uncharacterized protein n=1 Tax=Geosporobacter subterraneus DSM 17957 TaxID=1121919 RepID=A0A1M6DL35_9FIRM|nr:hypothetical protein [Geosporobacter subterraneus]SHI74024.1 hypothetical protein SAMN02745975_00497 [Geosporobacter subterraneus DSM 17957]